MPGGDRTGPMGMGPMTGRAAGYCAGSPVPGCMNNAAGRGFGGGFGRGFGGGGRGRRNRYYATGLTGWQQAAAAAPPVTPQSAPVQAAPVEPAISRKQELDALRQQAEFLGDSLEQIKSRIEELQTQPQAE